MITKGRLEHQLTLRSYIIIRFKFVNHQNYRMKKYLLLLSTFFISFQLSSQSLWYLGKFKVQKIGVSLGADQDRIHNMDSAYFMDQLEANQKIGFQDIDIDNYYLEGGICENPHARLSMTLAVPKVSKLEWTNSLVLMAGRIDGVSYEGKNDLGDSQYLTMRQTQDEIALESTMIYRHDLGMMKLYGGAGTNLGVTFNNRINISATNVSLFDFDGREFNDSPLDWSSPRFNQIFNTKQNVNQRIFLQGGMAIVLFKRLEMGMDVRYGIGYRAAKNADIRRTNLVSTGFTAKWVLK